MIIGIDASKAAIKNKTGVEVYVYSLLLNLKKIDDKNTYLLFTNKPLPNELLSANFKQILIPFPKFWNTFRLPLELLRCRPDIYISTVNSLPFYTPRKTIQVIHDLAYKYFPEAYSSKEKYLNEKTYRKATKATAIVCVSENTKNDFVKFYPRTKAKFIIDNLSYDENVFNDKNLESDFKITDTSYLLSVGRLEKRKNTINIVKAFNRIKKIYSDPLKLVLVGGKGCGYDSIMSEIDKSPYKADIMIPGHIEQKDMPALYKNAAVFLYPSLYEGFGIAILEAMRSGTPVVTSDVSSMPSVANNAAVLVDPSDVDGIAQKTLSILQSKELRLDLIQKGKKNIENFSWQKHAKTFLETINSL